MTSTIGKARFEGVASVSHPGRILRETYIEPRRLTTGEVAVALKITRQTLSDLLNGHKSVTPEMAVRISKVFGTVPEMWLMLQMQYDLIAAKTKLEEVEFERVG